MEFYCVCWFSWDYTARHENILYRPPIDNRLTFSSYISSLRELCAPLTTQQTRVPEIRRFSSLSESKGSSFLICFANPILEIDLKLFIGLKAEKGFNFWKLISKFQFEIVRKYGVCFQYCAVIMWFMVLRTIS